MRSVTMCLRPVPDLPAERGARGAHVRQTAHVLLAETLAGLGAEVPAAFPAGPHGKPYLPGGPHFSLTHCTGLAACAAGPVECGIDAEPLDRLAGGAVKKRVCSAGELAFLEASEQPLFDFLRLWTLKESFVKAIGMGLAFPLRDAAFLPEGDMLRFCREGFRFRQFAAGTHLVSLCLLGGGGENGVVRIEKLSLPADETLRLSITF